MSDSSTLSHYVARPKKIDNRGLTLPRTHAYIGSMSTHPMQRYIAEAEALRAELRATFGDDEQLLVDTIEGATSLDKVVDTLDAGIFNDENIIAGLKKGKEDIEARMERLKKRVEVQRALAKKALEIAGWNRARECTYATIGLQNKAPALGKIQESKITASRFWKTKDPELDRKALLDALKAGEKIEGAELEPPGAKVLTYRRR